MDVTPQWWNFLYLFLSSFHKNLGLFMIFLHPIDVYLRHCLRAAKTSVLLARGMNHSPAFHTRALCGFARRAIATETAAKLGQGCCNDDVTQVFSLIRKKTKNPPKLDELLLHPTTAVGSRIPIIGAMFLVCWLSATLPLMGLKGAFMPSRWPLFDYRCIKAFFQRCWE